MCAGILVEGMDEKDELIIILLETAIDHTN